MDETGNKTFAIMVITILALIAFLIIVIGDFNRRFTLIVIYSTLLLIGIALMYSVIQDIRTGVAVFRFMWYYDKKKNPKGYYFTIIFYSIISAAFIIFSLSKLMPLILS